MDNQFSVGSQRVPLQPLSKENVKTTNEDFIKLMKFANRNMGMNKNELTTEQTKQSQSPILGWADDL